MTTLSADWDIAELDAAAAAAEEGASAARAAKFDALVRPAYQGRLCRLPGETGRTYAKRKRAARPRPGPEPSTRQDRQRQLTAAYLREVRRLSDSRVLTRSEARQMMGLEDPPGWFARNVLGRKDARDLGAYGI